MTWVEQALQFRLAFPQGVSNPNGSHFKRFLTPDTKSTEQFLDREQTNLKVERNPRPAAIYLDFGFSK